MQQARKCGRWSAKGPTKDGRTPFVALGCKAWACRRCGAKKAAKLKKAIGRAAEARRLTRLLTLTLDTERMAEADLKDGGVRYLRNTWRKLREYLRRRYGKALPFIAVVEMQARGVAHMHVLLDRFIPQVWIRDAWFALGGGRIVDIRQVDLHRVAAYLAGYVTKDALGGLGSRVRRYSTSADIQLWTRVKSTWQMVRSSLEHMQERASAARWVLYRIAWDEVGVCLLVIEESRSVPG